MQENAYSLFQKFDKLYLNQIDPNSIKDVPEFITTFLALIITLSVFHAIIIYLFANLTNTYKYLRLILISTIYAIAVSFSIGKIFETLIYLFLGNIPFAGTEISVFNVYVALAAFYAFETLLITNRLKVLFDRGRLETEPISTDIFLGVTVANLLTLLFFVFLP